MTSAFPKQYTDQELCDAVFDAVKQAAAPLSRKSIAEAIGRKKTPRVIAMIEHLTDHGYFTRASGNDKQGRVLLLYQWAGKNGEACADQSSGVAS